MGVQTQHLPPPSTALSLASSWLFRSRALMVLASVAGHLVLFAQFVCTANTACGLMKIGTGPGGRWVLTLTERAWSWALPTHSAMRGGAERGQAGSGVPSSEGYGDHQPPRSGKPSCGENLQFPCPNDGREGVPSGVCPQLVRVLGAHASLVCACPRCCSSVCMASVAQIPFV